MKRIFTTKRICRAGVIAALYVALTYAFAPLAFDGMFQIRPAEALCILPLFFPEAVPALYVGCMLSNLASPFLIYDVFVGSLATLVAALATYGMGRLLREESHSPLVHVGRVAFGGLFPVLANAFLIPVVIVYLCGDTEGFANAGAAYWTFFVSMIVTESIWIYGLGAPLYAAILKLRRKNISVFVDKKIAPPQNPQAPAQT